MKCLNLIISCSTYRDHQSTQAILIEKLVSGKLPKQQFVDQEAALIKKKVECLDKMNHITSLLRYVQGSSKRQSLGCVNSHPDLRACPHNLHCVASS